MQRQKEPSFGSPRHLSIRWDNSPTVWLGKTQRISYAVQEHGHEAVSLGRELGTSVEHHSGTGLKVGGREEGYRVNSDRFVILLCVFLSEHTASFSCIICSFLQSFCISQFFFSKEGKIAYFF